MLVGDTGIEPVTSSVSGKRSPAELIALHHSDREWPYCEVGTGFEPVYTALQAVASPLGHPTAEATQVTAWTSSSGRRDSNPRPSPWQGDALPTALRPLASRPGGLRGPATVSEQAGALQTGSASASFAVVPPAPSLVGYPTPRRARQIPSPGELPAGAGGDGLPPAPVCRPERDLLVQ